MNKISGCTFLVYIDWYKDLDEMTKYCLKLLDYLPAAFCIHDKDVYDRDDFKLGITKGMPKKIHAHFCMNGKLSKKQQDIVEGILHCPTHLPAIQTVHDGTSMFNYLNHSDFSSETKGKVVYSDEDVHMSDFFDKSEFLQIRTDTFTSRMYDIIDQYGFLEVSTFMRYVKSLGEKEFFDYCHNNIFKIKLFIDSDRMIYNQRLKDNKED